MSKHSATYPVVSVIDGQPTFETELSLILAECEVGGAIKVLSPLEYHTDRQRKWYKGVALKAFMQEGWSQEEADHHLKAECGGNELLKREKFYMGKLSNGQPVVVDRLTIVGVGKRNMSTFIDNILAYAGTQGIPLPPPDPELRTR